MCYKPYSTTTTGLKVIHKSVVVDVGVTEQSKEVHGVFQVVGEMWDETLMKSVGSTSLASEKEDASVSSIAVDAC